LSRAKVDVKYFNPFLPFQDAEYRTVYVRLGTVEQMPVSGVLSCNGASVRLLFQAHDDLPKPSIPFQCGVGMLGVDVLI